MVPPEASQAKQLIKELSIVNARSGGPGGQHLNKTNSAVRVKHNPTGISVREEGSRSQHTNKRVAIERIKAISLYKNIEAKKALLKSRWGQHDRVQSQAPSIVYEGLGFTRI